MALNSTKNLIKSLSDYMTGAKQCLVELSVPFPRWIPPAAMTEGTFEKEAENQYRQEITKIKNEQDAEKLVNRGNEYYFLLIAKKAYVMLNRNRIKTAAVSASISRAMSDPQGFLKTKYIHVGDKVNANDI